MPDDVLDADDVDEQQAMQVTDEQIEAVATLAAVAVGAALGVTVLRHVRRWLRS